MYEYVLLFIVAVIISLIMYNVHLKDVNNELKQKNDNLRVSLIKKDNEIKVNNFEKIQLENKVKIKDKLKERKNEKDINLSIGSHIYDF